MDAAQSIGHMCVDVKKLNCDFLVFSGHKGVMGPTGVGVLYINEKFQDFLNPMFAGGGTIKDLKDNLEMVFLDPPEKFEAGTPNIVGVIGLGAAIDYIMDMDLNRIERYERILTKELIGGLTDLNIEWYGRGHR